MVRRWKFHLAAWLTILSGMASPNRPSQAVNPRAAGTDTPTNARHVLEGTAPFAPPDNIIEKQYQRVYKYFLREIAATPVRRDRLWRPDYFSVAAYHSSLVGHRESLRKMLGLGETASGEAAAVPEGDDGGVSPDLLGTLARPQSIALPK